MPSGTVRRGGGVSAYQQTYTLGPQERFRLDAVNFSVAFAYDGTTLNPTLRVADAGGATIAEIAATQEDILGPPGFNVFDYSGPAVFSDDWQLQPPRGYYGYVLHDFGAALTTSQMTIDWGLGPTARAGWNTVWLRSPGAVTYGGVIGAATALLSNTVTVPLTAGVAAGRYVLLQVCLVDQTHVVRFGDPVTFTATDNVGGNVLVPETQQTGAAPVWVATGDGYYIEAFTGVYRINNALAAGDRIVCTLPDQTLLWFGVQAHVVTGLNFANPYGPNPGGNYLGVGEFPVPGSPFTTPAVPTPIWTGPVLTNAVHPVPSPNTLDVSMARGLTYFAQPLNGVLSVGGDYTQMALPELHLKPRDTVSVLALDANGDPRPGDLVSDLLLYGVDE